MKVGGWARDLLLIYVWGVRAWAGLTFKNEEERRDLGDTVEEEMAEFADELKVEDEEEGKSQK